MLIIPVQPTPSQTLSTTLASQATQLQINQKSTGMFINVYLNNALVLGGVICQDRNRIIRNAYFGYVGDFIFADTQGTDDPYYTGLGSRYLLIYLEQADLLGLPPP